MRLKVPAAADRLTADVVAFVQRLRRKDLFKSPGVAETIEWAQALVALERTALDAEVVDATLGVVLKYQDDIARIRGEEARQVLAEMAAEGPGG